LSLVVVLVILCLGLLDVIGVVVLFGVVVGYVLGGVIVCFMVCLCGVV